jgi:hypothetical protein
LTRSYVFQRFSVSPLDSVALSSAAIAELGTRLNTAASKLLAAPRAHRRCQLVVHCDGIAALTERTGDAQTAGEPLPSSGLIAERLIKRSRLGANRKAPRLRVQAEKPCDITPVGAGLLAPSGVYSHPEG